MFYFLQIRSFGVTLSTVAINSIAFVVVKSFPILCEIIQMYGCMMIFSICCACGVLFVIFVMDETKGKALDVAQGSEKSEKNNAGSKC